MTIQLDVSKLEMITIQRIAEETDDVVVLGKLVNIDNVGVMRAVISNPATTKPIRRSIYDIWKKKSGKREVVLELVECPLDADTISDILKNEAFKWEHVCVMLVKQHDIRHEDLERIYKEVTAPNRNTDFANSVLPVMAEREDLTEELANKLLSYSTNVARIIADTYRKFLRVDFSKGQTE